jgi:hypothetical protein
VNQRDIGRGLYTPDVPYPPPPSAPESFIFPSALPQALSTRAEMMERYQAPPRDGVTGVLERVHVTGGTNGILVDACGGGGRSHRPSSAVPKTRRTSCRCSGRPGRAWHMSTSRAW